MAKTETEIDRSIDLEYGDFISPLYNSEDKQAEKKDVELVEELKRDDDSELFSQDEGDIEEVRGMDSCLAVQHRWLQVCDPCEDDDSTITEGGCSSLNSHLVSSSDALGGYESTMPLPETSSPLIKRPDVESGESASDQLGLLENPSTSESSENKDANVQQIVAVQNNIVNKDETDDSDDIRDALRGVEQMQQALECPTCTSDQSNLRLRHPHQQLAQASETPVYTATTNEGRPAPEAVSEITDSSHKRILEQPQKSNDAQNEEGVIVATQTKKPMEIFVETSFLSTTFLDESVSDWDESSMEEIIASEKKARKFKCYIIGNVLLAIVIIVMSTLIAYSVIGATSSSSSMAIVATEESASLTPSNSPSDSPTTIAASHSPSYNHQLTP
ncbi:unnamed protein product [Cylindrotheca closterium]|uniref:Uncharacterized protein n=1 Tax=Cylindrotheca closterium TaxID=2856 RepID=A0AAD2G5L7_9STRA|nr:unnamed protein product [Cylindrotheca closterium]